MLYEELTQRIIGALIEVHKQLGAGLLESAYEQAFCYELSQRGLAFQRQVSVPVRYKGIQLDCGYRLDVLVEDTVIVELKSVEQLMPIHEAQLLTHMRLAGKRVGFLVNFNVLVLMDGLIRRVL